MSLAFVDAFELIPETALVVWSAWGFEYFHLLEERYGSVVLDRTQRLCRSMLWRKRMRNAVTPSGLRDLLGNLGRRVRGTSEDPYGLPTVAKRIDVVSINASDLPRIKAVLPAMRAVNHLLPYYTTEDTLENGPPNMCGPDILLGNSATATNNHLEAFEELRKLDLKGRRIVTPLSYGDMEYADHVCRLGAKRLGSSFAPLRDFLSLTEFNKEIAECGTVVMNHVRQQAMGTISAALYKKAQVYLRPESLLFDYFRGLGIRVHSVSELGKQVWDGRGEAAGDENSRLIGDFWSRERAVSQIRLLSQIHEERRLARGST